MRRASSLSCRNPAAELISIVMQSGHSYFTIRTECRFWSGLCVEMIQGRGKEDMPVNMSLLCF